MEAAPLESSSSSSWPRAGTFACDTSLSRLNSRYSDVLRMRSSTSLPTPAAAMHISARAYEFALPPIESVLEDDIFFRNERTMRSSSTSGASGTLRRPSASVIVISTWLTVAFRSLDGSAGLGASRRSDRSGRTQDIGTVQI
jgi:hypothetical protein